MSNTMIIRVRSNQGIKRYELDMSTVFGDLLGMVERDCGLDASMYELKTMEPTKGAQGHLNTDSLFKVDFSKLRETRVRELGLNNGHLFTVYYLNRAPVLKDIQVDANLIHEPILEVAEEDKVDLLLEKMDGKIDMPKTSLCNHLDTSKCINCLSLDPWDLKIQEGKGIKHLSFHSYIRKCRHEQHYLNLEELDLALKRECKTHAPWPEGICTHCMPPAITLNRQTYRQVDYIEFESPEIIDRFLSFWRQSGGNQRLGLLLGKYEPYLDVPLGIKAVVSAIYEPPQYNEITALQMLTNEHVPEYLWLTKELGLKEVGYIFTDLEDDGTNTGAVMYKRHKDSYFLTSMEVLFSAEQQISHPNYTKASKKGTFGSKYVTVVVSGDDNNGVGLKAYQISDQGTSLAKYNVLVPSRTAGMARIKESSPSQFVPECFYSYKDEYNNDVTKPANPFIPLDYLVVNLETGAPTNPECLFQASLTKHDRLFTVANRDKLGTIQSASKLIQLIDAGDVELVLSDYHVLLWLITNPNETIPKQLIQSIIKCIIDKKKDQLNDLCQSNEWKKFISALKQKGGANINIEDPPSDGNDMVDNTHVWQCTHCTVINEDNGDSCYLCALPRHA